MKQLRGMTEADTFNTETFPYGVKAGDNKGQWHICPFCKKLPTHPTDEEWPWGSGPPKEGLFLFKDSLSAQEYRISGLCQTCQDKTFVEPSE